MGGAWTRILGLTAKEFLALLKDPKSRVVVIVPPLIQLLIFGYAATYDLKNVPYAVLNEDTGPAARQFLARFEGSSNFRRVADLQGEAQMTSLVNSRQVLLVIHIHRQFSQDLALGQPGRVEVILDGRNSNTALIALGYVNTISADFIESWSRDHALPSPPVRLETRAWYNPNLESRWFLVPGIVGLLTLVVTTLVTTLSVAREREQGTFDQLLVTPLRPIEILIGKALPGFVIGLAEATVIITLVVLWFKVPLLGSLPTLYAGLVLFVFSAIGMGLAISSLSATMQQGLLGAFLFLMPAVILSGFTTPVANMPRLVQQINLINPLRYFVVIVRSVFLEGATFASLKNELWPMAIIGLVTLTLAGWLFRHRRY